MDSIEDRLPPHSVEAEEAVLGSLLIDPDAIYEVASFLKPDAFYRAQNRWIYESILALNERRVPLDVVTLIEELRHREVLDEIGGEPTVINLLNAVPTSINAEAYGRMVEAASTRRKLILAAGSIAKLAYNEAEDINVVLDRSELALFSISEQRTNRDLKPVREIAGDYLERIELLRERGDEFIGIPTGFNDLDRMLSGLNKSDLIIVAARPGMGKTALQNAVALNAARRYNKRVAMFNLEMSGEQLVQRMIAAETRIDSQRLRRGDLADHEWAIFLEALGRLSETKIFIDDTPSITPMQLRTKCRRLYAEHGLDLIMIDYLQLMSAEHPTSNRVQEVSEISRELKGWPASWMCPSWPPPSSAAPWSSARTSDRCCRICATVGPSSRTPTSSCSSIATITITRRLRSGRISPRSTWPSTATAPPDPLTCSGTASWPPSATCTSRKWNYESGIRN